MGKKLVGVGLLLGALCVSALGDSCAVVRVTAAGSGLPISEAAISISQGVQLVAQAETGEDGLVNVRNLTPGSYRVRVTHSGYRDLSSGSGQRWSFRPPDQCSLTVSLTQTAVISGTILKQDGQAATGVLVGALVRTKAGMKPVTGPPIVTDDRGTYRIYDLVPGRYAVAVLPEPDTEIVAPVFFPGTTDAGKAQFLDLHQGEERSEVNVTVPAMETHSLEGVITGIPSSWNGERAVVWLATRGEVRVPVASTLMDASGHFKFPSVPAGEYEVSAFGPADAADERTPKAGASTRTGTIAISMGGSDQQVELALKPMLPVEGQFVFKDGASRATCGMLDHILFHSEDGWMEPLALEIKMKADHFTTAAIPLGHYTIELPDLEEPCRLTQTSVVVNGVAPVTLTLSAGMAQ